MVYHHRTVKCPNCGKVTEHTRTKEYEELTGSPFRVCPNCKKVYFDGEYKEPALSIFNDKGGEFNFWHLLGTLAFNAGLVFLVIDGAKHGFEWVAIGIMGFLSLVFDAGLIRVIINRTHAEKYHQEQIDTLEGRKGTQTAELKASLERMSDKAYLDALRAHGVVVPEYFYERMQKRSSISNTNIPDMSKPTANNQNYAEEIRNLKKLLDDGIITQEEFDAKKKQLLGL